MMSIVGWISIMIFIVYVGVGGFMYYRRIREHFNVVEVLKVETLILFSNYELAKRIRKILKRTGKGLKIQCGDYYYLDIKNDAIPKEIISKLELLQELMISKRYDNKNEIIIKDSIDKRVFDIWLDYGYKKNYRKILKRELFYLLHDGEISNSTYNEAYRRAISLERNIYRSGGL